MYDTNAIRAALRLASAVCALAMMPAGHAAAQPTHGTAKVRVLAEGLPVQGARVSAGAFGGLTDVRGEASLRLPAGAHTLEVTSFGLISRTLPMRVRAGLDTLVVVALERDVIEHEGIIVSSTRAERRIEDEPVRVEVIGREEVEEKLLMTPGDISMLLNETAGLRVQPAAASLGGASVRIQGLRGRYTRILSDGLPLYGGQAGALGPLQIPPMDLAQVEVIKGAASALHGAAALGGVVNLISRRPATGGQTEVLLNQTTQRGTDAILWRSDAPGERWGYTLLASGHRQEQVDVDSDGWSDLPGFRRAFVRPRLFLDNGSGASGLLTLGAMVEEREGGSLPGRRTPDGSTVREELRTERLDGGTQARILLGETRLLTLRGSGSLQRHEHRFTQVLERDAHATAFAEAALTGTAGAHAWVLGGAVQVDDFRARSLDGFDYTHVVPALFMQDEYEVADWLTLAASGRLDHHSEHGAFLSPRLSALLRPAGEWAVRASAGGGFSAPTPWTAETEAVGLSRVVPPADLEVERARSASVDVGRHMGPFEFNATLFGSAIDDPVQARLAGPDGTLIELFNAEGSVRSHGTELLGRYHQDGIHVTATYVYLRASEPEPRGEGRREVPLTPRHTAGMVAAWEKEGLQRLAAEFYYTGKQELSENPYRTVSEPHVVVGFLAERRFGSVRLFLNAENLLDTRQTRHDPLLLPARSPEGRWTTDVWAPLEGRAFNAGVRWER